MSIGNTKHPYYYTDVAPWTDATAILAGVADASRNQVRRALIVSSALQTLSISDEAYPGVRIVSSAAVGAAFVLYIEVGIGQTVAGLDPLTVTAFQLWVS